MGNNRRGGILAFKINGEIMDCEGEFEYTLSGDERTSVKGPDRVHGYTAEPRQPGIKGAILDRRDLDMAKINEADDVTATLTLGNGKKIALREAWSVGPATGKTTKGSFDIELHGKSCREVV